MHIDYVEHLPVRSDVVRTAQVSAPWRPGGHISSERGPLVGIGKARSDLRWWRRGMGPMGDKNRAVLRETGRSIRGYCVEPARPSSPAL